MTDRWEVESKSLGSVLLWLDADAIWRAVDSRRVVGDAK
jgi:hypothetical protein